MEIQEGFLTLGEEVLHEGHLEILEKQVIEEGQGRNKSVLNRSTKMKQSSLIIMCIFSCTFSPDVLAQYGYFREALLFSKSDLGGSARIQAIGNAQMALGGDMSTININPASLGKFRGTVIQFTPSLDFNKNDVQYYENTSKSFLNSFNFEELGIAFNTRIGKGKEKAVRSVNFSLTFNRVGNYDDRYLLDGRNNESSIVDYFIESAGVKHPNELDDFTGTAYNHFLIDEADYDSDEDYLIETENGHNYISINEGDGSVEGYSSLVGKFGKSFPQQSENVRTEGRQQQTTLATAINYDDIFFVGFGVGFRNLRYKKTRTFRENNFLLDNQETDNLLQSIQITNVEAFNGNGVNFSLGVLLRVFTNFNLGLSFQSPSYLSLDEKSNFSFTTKWNSNYSYKAEPDTVLLDVFSEESANYETVLSIKTPPRLNAGISYFFGKKGFISGDIEYIDYKNILINSSDFVATADNNAVSETYRPVINYRFGAEVKVKSLILRGGYRLEQLPYEPKKNEKNKITYSTGIGFRNKSFFIDFTYLIATNQYSYSPYFINENTPVSTVKDMRSLCSFYGRGRLLVPFCSQRIFQY